MDPLKLQNIPDELKAHEQWVLWKYIRRDGSGKPTKVPYQPSGVEAKSNDQVTWSPFEKVMEGYLGGGYEGVGLMFHHSDPYCGIDLDGCREPSTGDNASWAKPWLQAACSYCEVSPSGSGWKIFCRGKSKFDTGKKCDLPDEPPRGGKNAGVEIYDKLRWFAMTGWRGKYKTIMQCQDVIDAFCSEYWPPNVPRQHSAFQSDAKLLENARKYIMKIPPAVAGQGGHNQAYHVACILVVEFAIPPSDGYAIFAEWSAGCVPPWSEKEIWHKLNDANKVTGTRGKLRNTAESDWSKVEVPNYVMPKRKARATNASSPNITHSLEFTTIQDSATSYLDALKTRDPFVELAIPELNYALEGGVERGEMVIIAARPSHGKSAFALQCLHECSLQQKTCLLISEEMSTLAIGKRTVQYVSGVHQEHWLGDRHIVDRHLEMHFKKRKRIHIAESCRTAQNVEAAIQKGVDEHGVEVVAVDYAQLLTSTGGSRYEQVTYTSMLLHQLALKHNVVMLTLCQLGRDIEKRNTFVPKLIDLKDSGQIEQDADVIIFLVWPHRIDPKCDPKEFQIFIAKNRNRGTQVSAFQVEFNPLRQMFLEEQPVGQADPPVKQRADLF